MYDDMRSVLVFHYLRKIIIQNRFILQYLYELKLRTLLRVELYVHRHTSISASQSKIFPFSIHLIYLSFVSFLHSPSHPRSHCHFRFHKHNKYRL